MKKNILPLALASVLWSVVDPTAAAAQSMMDRLKDKAKARVEARTDEALDKALEKAEKSVDCLVGDRECIDRGKKAGKTVNVHRTPEDLEKANEEREATLAAAARKESAAPDAAQDAKAWTNFDFVPGERVLFADDFSRDRVGNFPQRLELLEGNAQVVEAGGRRWLSATSLTTIVAVPLPEALPRRFTMEFDLQIPGGFPTKIGSIRTDDADPNADAASAYAFYGPFASGLIGGGARSETDTKVNGRDREETVGQLVKGRLQVDGDYVKVYLNEQRIANVPSAKLTRGNKVYLSLHGSSDAPALIGNLTIAAGGLGMYDALVANGRVATQGIFFDTGSDRIRPESAPTLRIIGDMLREHGDLRLTIEGHTDNVGAAASNLSLSARRAAAVRTHLVTNFGIDGARLETKGLGDTQPAAPNTTSEGRQQNRRVELVKR